MTFRSLLIRLIYRTDRYVNAAAAVVRVTQEHQRDYRKQRFYNYKQTFGAVLISSALVGSAFTEKLDNKDKRSDATQDDNKIQANTEGAFEAGQKKPDLPTYTADEVMKHDNKDSFWVTYKHGVYDITKFLVSHPGGEQIMNAAGLSIEPFWNVYGMHKTQEVYKLLETFRIGNLHDEDVLDHSDDELWAKEPFRDKRLIVKTAKPFNAEIPAKLQIQHFDTPNELFYVRQHMPVPDLDAREHKVRITIRNGKVVVKEFTLQELEEMFGRITVRAALMCAGNRRSEMNEQVKPVKGISWAGGAISNAVWSGVPLRDVLLYCGVEPEHTRDMHVIFAGADMDATGVNFSTSIPLEQALNPNGRVLLATHMNGEPLPPDHGRPLRVVVPGAPAVRSVKWLESITVSRDESPSHWHQKDYRSFNASTTWETAQWASAPPVYSVPVTCAICEPLAGDCVRARDGHLDVRGYAYSGGGAKILRVDVSADRGRTWVPAHELRADDAPPQRHYGWTLWAARVPLDAARSEVELWAKATDSNFNTQPEKFEDIWNIRGILSNAYHRVAVRVAHDRRGTGA